MKNEALKLTPMPCPFCGESDVAVYVGSTFRWRYAACDSCGARAGEVRAQTFGDGTREQWEAAAIESAIAEWNCRAAIDAAMKPQDG